ncbi:MAG: helix-turn-helix transcriptional regulator [Ktedonobacteraceae bacterium]|nr:helix-turn-helix transcriptional regulator [Ktedonobacteraceae bacterium]MBO0790008.1 helix-turn-helix transcriptional regulator [Ktedonobacteraceae bacterium]
MTLKEFRVELGWNHKKLAEEAGLSRQAISHAESGQRISAITAKALADALSKGYDRQILVREIEGLNIV